MTNAFILFYNTRTCFIYAYIFYFLFLFLGDSQQKLYEEEILLFYLDRYKLKTRKILTNNY